MSDGCFTLWSTAMVIFAMKTGLDVFNLKREHVWTCSVLSDCICETKRVTESGRQGILTSDHFLLQPLLNPVTQDGQL